MSTAANNSTWFSHINWVDTLPFIHANCLPWNADFGNFSTDKLLNIDNIAVMNAFQEVYSGDYKLVWKTSTDNSPFTGVTIKFNKSEDEMWFRLKHG